MEALATASAPAEHLGVLGLGVVVLGLGRQLEMRLDDVGDVAQDGGGALLAVLVDIEREPVETPGFHGGGDVARR